MKLKNIIRDLIDNEVIMVDQQAGNKDLKIYTNPMLDHNKGNENGKGKGYTNVNHVYNNVVASLDDFISVVTIKGPNIKCGVTTRRGKLNIQGASQQPRTPPTLLKSNTSDYSFLDQLKKTPT